MSARPFKLHRQISGDTIDGAGQRRHDRAQDEMEVFFQELGLSSKTAESVAMFIASKHSYSNHVILDGCERSAKVVVKVIFDYVDSNSVPALMEQDGMSYYGIKIDKDMRKELFDLLKKMIEPTPSVSNLITPEGRKVPLARNLAVGLKAYLEDPESTYSKPQEVTASLTV